MKQRDSLIVYRFKKSFDEPFASHSYWTNDGIYYDEGRLGPNLRRRAGFNKMVDDALAVLAYQTASFRWQHIGYYSFEVIAHRAGMH
ncbi:MAG TPA: hypothetical protein DCR94_03860 [Firmicutes bacterium]|nr:hypothetical protein [Bacillota bacterium]